MYHKAGRCWCGETHEKGAGTYSSLTGQSPPLPRKRGGGPKKKKGNSVLARAINETPKTRREKRQGKLWAGRRSGMRIRRDGPR